MSINATNILLNTEYFHVLKFIKTIFTVFCIISPYRFQVKSPYL